MRCLRRIAHVKWQDKVPNTEAFQICGITGIEAFLLAAQFRWSGHVARFTPLQVTNIKTTKSFRVSFTNVSMALPVYI